MHRMFEIHRMFDSENGSRKLIEEWEISETQTSVSWEWRILRDRCQVLLLITQPIFVQSQQLKHQNCEICSKLTIKRPGRH